MYHARERVTVKGWIVAVLDEGSEEGGGRTGTTSARMDDPKTKGATLDN